jgi:hypothetical protein
MAVAPELLGDLAVARAARRTARVLPSGGQTGHAGMAIRMVWALAAALIVLEVISLATGRFWSWDFGAPFRAVVSPPRPYTSLPGGAIADTAFAAASAPGAAFPHGPADRNTAAAPADAGNLGSGRL